MPHYDLLTVTHFEELGSLRLQAKSIAKWLRTDGLGRIWLVINESDTTNFYEEIVNSLPSLYGQHSSRLTVLNREEVCKDLHRMPGYVSQQVIKLRMAKKITNPFYTVLDTKNSLIGPVGNDYFFKNTLPKARFETYLNSHQAYILDKYYEFFGVPQEMRRNNLPAMMTPFTFEVKAVHEAVRFAEESLKASIETCFETIFKEKYLFSEFLLFCSAIQAQGKNIDDFYAKIERASMTIWPNQALGIDGLRATLKSALHQRLFIVGIHVRRIKQMEKEETEFLTTFFRERGVLSSVERFDFQDFASDLE